MKNKELKLICRERKNKIEIYKTKKHLFKKCTVFNFSHRGTKADIGVIKQIFEDGDYDLSKLKRYNDIYKAYRDILNKGYTPLIIDCGANIGASSLYLYKMFPEAKVFAIEPDKDNFSFLKKNTRNVNIKLLNCAVSSTSGQSVLVDTGEGEWGYRLGKEGEQGNVVNVNSMNQILDGIENDNLTPFILKIDIEGGEKELFSKNTSWFDDFYLAIIELHDWLYPKQNTSLPFIKMISRLNRDFVYIRENIFSIKN